MVEAVGGGRRVMIAAGGTGGHVFPAVAVGEALAAAGGVPLWMGSRAEDGDEAARRGWPVWTVPYAPPRGWRQGFALARAVGRARRGLAEARPARVLCMGGFAGVPCGMAARVGGVPVLVHEQNAVMGRANRLLARLGARVLTGCVEGGGGGAEFVGNPVRAAFARGAARGARAAGVGAARRFLVLGGSQGAAALNALAPAALAVLAEAAGEEVRVVHQCGRGEGRVAEVRAAYARGAGVGVAAEVVEFVEDVAAAMAGADLALCRAGAATLAELAAAGLGAVLVPYPHAAANHQLANARLCAAAGAAVLCEEAGLTAEGLAAAVRGVDAAALGRGAAGRAAPNAAAAVAAACLRGGGGGDAA